MTINPTHLEVIKEKLENHKYSELMDYCRLHKINLKDLSSSNDDNNRAGATK